MNPYDEIPPADPQAVQSVNQLCSKIKTLYPRYATSFEENPDLISSPELLALADLGAKCIPFYVDNEIETKPQFKVDRKNWLYYCTLQRHANLLVDINYDRYKNIEEALEELKASVQQKYDNIDTNLTDYVDDDAYKRLTELGEGAIAHIMVEWKTSSNEQANRIWELLINDIIHGRRLGNLESRLGHWEDWSDWFENKDFDDAP